MTDGSFQSGCGGVLSFKRGAENPRIFKAARQRGGKGNEPPLHHDRMKSAVA